MSYGDEVPSASGELDCDPYTFDVMALWATYQMVKP